MFRGKGGEGMGASGTEGVIRYRPSRVRNIEVWLYRLLAYFSHVYISTATYNLRRRKAVNTVALVSANLRSTAGRVSRCDIPQGCTWTWSTASSIIIKTKCFSHYPLRVQVSNERFRSSLKSKLRSEDDNGSGKTGIAAAVHDRERHTRPKGTADWTSCCTVCGWSNCWSATWFRIECPTVRVATDVRTLTYVITWMDDVWRSFCCRPTWHFGLLQ